MTKHPAIRYMKPGPDVIRLTVIIYVRFLLSLRDVDHFFVEII